MEISIFWAFSISFCPLKMCVRVILNTVINNGLKKGFDALLISVLGYTNKNPISLRKSNQFVLITSVNVGTSSAILVMDGTLTNSGGSSSISCTLMRIADVAELTRPKLARSLATTRN